MADVSRDPREHWLKPHFSKNEVANSGNRILSANYDIIYEHMHEANFHEKSVSAEQI